MSDRHIVVVDTETNGLDTRLHVPIEVAWWNLNTGESGRFTPYHPDWEEVERTADPKALELNGYYDRIKPYITATSEQEQRRSSGAGWLAMYETLRGNTLAGSNPSFDEHMLIKSLFGYPVWHHRKLDLGSYAAGVLGLEVSDLPGLASVANALGVEWRYDEHSAWGDVDVTGRCFKTLFKTAAREES